MGGEKGFIAGVLVNKDEGQSRNATLGERRETSGESGEKGEVDPALNKRLSFEAGAVCAEGKRRRESRKVKCERSQWEGLFFCTKESGLWEKGLTT